MQYYVSLEGYSVQNVKGHYLLSSEVWGFKDIFLQAKFFQSEHGLCMFKRDTKQVVPTCKQKIAMPTLCSKHQQGNTKVTIPNSPDSVKMAVSSWGSFPKYL